MQGVRLLGIGTQFLMQNLAGGTFIRVGTLIRHCIAAGEEVYEMFVNHRAKRGGSLFQGGSGERERGREATPPLWGRSPHQGREATLCWRWGTPPFVGFLATSCPKR